MLTSGFKFIRHIAARDITLGKRIINHSCVPQSRTFIHGATRDQEALVPLSFQQSIIDDNDITAGTSEGLDTIPGQDFFNYTSGRWIHNENHQLDSRRVSFSVTALKAVASRLVNASECTRMVKFPEGLYNRAFLLPFNNGTEVVARIPTSLAGPAHWTTASEVATMKFIYDLGIPIPKVLTWSSRADTDVGCEYIIMEKAKGVPLLKVWDSLTSKNQRQVIAELVNVDKEMLSFEFSGFGSIFLKEDMIGDVQSLAINSNPDFSGYRIGPSITRDFWRGERMSMSIDRGPCKGLII